MKIANLSSNERKNLYENIRKDFDFMFQSAEEKKNWIESNLAKQNDREFENIISIKRYLNNLLLDEIAEDILENDSIKYMNLWIQKRLERAENSMHHIYGYKTILQSFTNFLLKVSTEIPYEKLEELVKSNVDLQNIIADYIELDNDFFKEEFIFKENNYYLRNLIFCYMEQNAIPFLPTGKKRNYSRDAIYLLEDIKQSYNPIPKIELDEKVRKAQDGNIEARNRIIEAYTPLLYKCAINYISNTEEVTDLFQEGVFGLMRAIQKYDANIGSFSGYARLCINSALYNHVRAVNDAATRRGKTESYEQLVEKEGETTELNEKFIHVEKGAISFVEAIEKEELRSILEMVIDHSVTSTKAKEVLLQSEGLMGREKKSLHQIAEESGKNYKAITSHYENAIKSIRVRSLVNELLDYSQSPMTAKKTLKKARENYWK